MTVGLRAIHGLETCSCICFVHVLVHFSHHLIQEICEVNKEYSYCDICYVVLFKLRRTCMYAVGCGVNL